MSESEFIFPSRRGFIGGLLALVAAPAVVRASSLMPIWPEPKRILTLNEIARKAVRLFMNTNVFIQNIHAEYDDEFNRLNFTAGTALRISLPNDYTRTVLSPV